MDAHSLIHPQVSLNISPISLVPMILIVTMPGNSLDNHRVLEVKKLKKYAHLTIILIQDFISIAQNTKRLLICP